MNIAERTCKCKYDVILQNDNTAFTPFDMNFYGGREYQVDVLYDDNTYKVYPNGASEHYAILIPEDFENHFTLVP